MKLHKLLISFISILVLYNGASSQISIKDSSLVIPSFNISYSYQFPLGDMADRYGSNSYIGPGFSVKLASNWIVGAELGFLFGKDIKNGFERFENIMTEDGKIISGDGVPAVIALYERGFALSFKFGRLFSVLAPNPNSGFVVHATAGYMQHKTRIDVQGENTPQLAGDYKKGYDRFTDGFTLSQAIGYQYMGNRRLVNFYVGVEIFEGFTKDRREYHFDLMGPEEKPKRIDILVGPKVMWIIPLYRRMPKEYYYY